MKLTQLKVFKSGNPVTLGKRVRKDCRVFSDDELNRMIDENIEAVRRKGYAELVVPSRLHRIRPDCLTENARTVADTLQRAGFHAYLCGGSVRDLIREEPVNDFDFVTDASNEQLAELFSGIRFHEIPAGHRFGYLAFGEEIIDIATYVNIPAAYQGLPNVPDFNPDALYSSSLLFDAYQRDFTCNSMYYDPASGDVISYFGGLYSLREGIIMTPVNAEAVFGYDPRRAMRALRFSSRLGFRLSDEAEAAVRAHGTEYVRRIDAVSMADNLPDFFNGGYARDGTEQLLDYHLFWDLFPAVRHREGNEEYRKYVLRTARAADWLFDEGTWALPMIVMAAFLWPAVREAREAGAEDPAEQVLRSQKKVLYMSEKDEEYFRGTLMIEQTDPDRDSIRRETSAIFDQPEFKDGLKMLRLHYLANCGRL